jgi:PAS domain S-box-containing protein
MPELIDSSSRRWDGLKQYFFPTLGELLVYESLPLIAYALDNQGVFLWYNAKCWEAFGLPESADDERNILSFYNSYRDREEFLNNLHRVAPGTWLENTLLDFKVNDKHHYLRDFSRVVTGVDGENLGVVSIMLTATKEERFQKLLERLPIGIFRFMQEGNGLDYANEKFVQMHGFEHLEEIKGKPVKKFIADSAEAKEMMEHVRQEGSLDGRHVKHVRQDGSFFWGSINAAALYNHAGEYIGTEGTVVDVTMEGLYNELIHLVPIGLFKVEINGKGEHTIVHCNTTFAQNLDYPSHKSLIGKDIRRFHGTLEEFDTFYAHMLDQESNGDISTPSIVRWLDANHEQREYQVYIQLERDAAGNVVGRVGAQRDVTEERKLEKRIQEIRADIGKVLHAYSTTLVMAKTNFDTVLHALTSGRTGYFIGNMFHEGDALAQIDQSVRSVRTIALRLRTELGQQASNNAIFTEIDRLIGLLREVTELEMANLFIAQNYEAAMRVNELLNENEFLKRQPKEKIRPFKVGLDELIRNTSIIFLHRGLEGVLEMEAPVQALRSYIIDGVKPKEEMSRIDIYEVLLDVIKNLYSYAASRGIEIKYYLREIQNLYLSGHESELKRAFINLLHNAIKYSWTRKIGTAPFVEITARKETNWLTITMVNRGVGISRQEIEEGRIFEFGYRGEKSNDRRRPGTGIGLYDSIKVLEAHKGKLIVESRPVSGNADIDTPNQPYFTTVTCRIPLNPS